MSSRLVAGLVGWGITAVLEGLVLIAPGAFLHDALLIPTLLVGVGSVTMTFLGAAECIGGPTNHVTSEGTDAEPTARIEPDHHTPPAHYRRSA